MSKSVVAKFKCLTFSPEQASAQIGLSAVVDDGSAENKSFFAATPSGDIRLAVVNKETADFFEPGAEYFVRFERVAKPEPATEEHEAARES